MRGLCRGNCDESVAATMPRPWRYRDMPDVIGRCLHGWDDDEWDERMRRDITQGKLSKVLKKEDSDIAEGNLSDMP